MIGANGAGKSTLLRTIAGLHAPSAGSVLFDGADVTRLRPERRARRGIVMVPEGRRLFGSLSVEENLQVGATYARSGPWTIERVYELFGWMRDRRGQRTAQLSGGEQQTVAHRPRAGRQPASAAAGRAVPGPGAGRRPAHLRHAAADPGHRPDRAAGRAGRQPGPAGWPRMCTACSRAGQPWRAGPPMSPRSRSRRPTSGWQARRRARPLKGASRNGVGQCHHPGRADRRAVRAVRLRAVADVRRHEGRQPRPRRPGRDRRLRRDRRHHRHAHPRALVFSHRRCR